MLERLANPFPVVGVSEGPTGPIPTVGCIIKPQPHEGKFASKIVDELRIRLIRGEQATFSCPFVTGERFHRNRPESTT